MEDAHRQLLLNIEIAITTNDSSKLEQNAFDLFHIFLEYGYFLEDIFDAIIKIIQMPEYLNMKDSFILLQNINMEIMMGTLSESQKNRLTDTLELIYSRLKDTTACMCAGEIIVNLNKNERGFQILNKLRYLPNDESRALMAYSLYYFIKECGDKALVKKALQELQQMRKDNAEIVQIEVQDALAKLGQKLVG